MLNVSVRIRVRFKIRIQFRVMVRVKDSGTVFRVIYHYRVPASGPQLV